MGCSAKYRHDMIIGWDISIKLVLNLKLSEHVIKVDDGHVKGYTTPMVDLGTYEFKYLNTGETAPEEFLLMLTLKNCISQNIYALPLNNYV